MAAQTRVVGPDRKRKTKLGGSAFVHQVERLAGVVFVFLQDPGNNLSATIGKRNAVQLVLDNGGVLGSRSNGRSKPKRRDSAKFHAHYQVMVL